MSVQASLFMRLWRGVFSGGCSCPAARDESSYSLYVRTIICSRQHYNEATAPPPAQRARAARRAARSRRRAAPFSFLAILVPVPPIPIRLSRKLHAAGSQDGLELVLDERIGVDAKLIGAFQLGPAAVGVLNMQEDGQIPPRAPQYVNDGVELMRP